MIDFADDPRDHESECASCFERIAPADDSFSVKYGRVHERCRREYKATMMCDEADRYFEEQGQLEPREWNHDAVPEWPEGEYKPWM